MPPFTATASCLASGLHASASTWGKRELTRRAATVDDDGEVLGFVLGDAVEPGVRDGEGKTGLRLTGSMIAPWSGSDSWPRGRTAPRSGSRLRHRAAGRHR